MFPDPPASPPRPPPPPPDPPSLPPESGEKELPPPPAVDVIVENTELFPLEPGLLLGGVPAAPPPPTVIGKDVAVTVTLLGALGYPSKGLAV